MGRAFPFTYQGRALRISNTLWTKAGSFGSSKASARSCALRECRSTKPWSARRGEDLIASIAEKAKTRILSRGLDLPLHDAQPDAWESSAYRLL